MLIFVFVLFASISGVAPDKIQAATYGQTQDVTLGTPVPENWGITRMTNNDKTIMYVGGATYGKTEYVHGTWQNVTGPRSFTST